MDPETLRAVKELEFRDVCSEYYKKMRDVPALVCCLYQALDDGSHPELCMAARARMEEFLGIRLS